MKDQILVTGYKSPDLDGAGGAYAYAELLKAKGQNVVAVVFGHLRKEAEFAFNHLRVKIEDGDNLYKNDTKVILVDSCEIKGISSSINPDNVIEAIDHRSVHNAHEEFKNAKIQIELVGSCATLIVEKFINSKIKPSEKSATLLYLAIVSNTINFKNKVTAERDIKAAKYLKGLYNIDDSLIHKMFAKQSELSGPIREMFQCDKWSNEISGKIFSIFQFEIIGVDEFVNNHLIEIKEALEEVQKESNFDFVLVTCVDLEKARNTFVVPDSKTEKLIGKILGVDFMNGVAHYPEIIMRKEIMPKIKTFFEKSQNSD